MPNDTIDRNIKKAEGDANAANYEHITYEGYGPNGTAIIVEALTDNRNRTATNVKNAFTKGKGNAVGYGLLLLLLGCVREWLSAGTVFGHVLSRPVLPMASMPAGGFIVLGVFL